MNFYLTPKASPWNSNGWCGNCLLWDAIHLVTVSSATVVWEGFAVISKSETASPKLVKGPFHAKFMWLTQVKFEMSIKVIIVWRATSDNGMLVSGWTMILFPISWIVAWIRFYSINDHFSWKWAPITGLEWNKHRSTDGVAIRWMTIYRFGNHTSESAAAIIPLSGVTCALLKYAKFAEDCDDLNLICIRSIWGTNFK